VEEQKSNDGTEPLKRWSGRRSGGRAGERKGGDDIWKALTKRKPQANLGDY